MPDEPASWHYTPGVAAAGNGDMGIAGILKTRVIRASTIALGRKERPAIWFSSAQRFEPTAAEVMLQSKSGKQLRALNVEDQAIQAGGLYRFGLPAGRVIPYLQSFRELGISQERRKRLARIGKQFGSHVRDWSVHIGPLPLDDPDLLFGYFLDGDWHSAPIDQAFAIFRRCTETFLPLFEKRLALLSRL